MTMMDILKEIAARDGLSLAELRGPTRVWRVSHPRQEFMARARELGRSYPQIGRMIGRDHSTVISGVRAYQARLAGTPSPLTARRLMYKFGPKEVCA